MPTQSACCTATTAFPPRARVWPRSFVALALLAAVVAGAAETRAREDVLASLRAGHPRLLLTDAGLKASLAAAQTDPLRAELHARLIALAEADLAAAPVRHEIVGPRLLAQSRACLGRVFRGAFAYRITGDTRFAERAKKEMLTAAAFPDWNPSHFLDVGEMSLGLALGYDWLHAQLTPEERSAIRAALVDKALAFAPTAYAGGKPEDRRLQFVVVPHNWNQVCNGGMLAAALALADEEPALARTVVAGVRTSLPLAMAGYAPDGAYPEGPSYWSYGTGYNVVALACLESALGTDFDLGREEGFDRTALYRLHVQGPTGRAFNYADAEPGVPVTAEYTWLATRYGHPVALRHARTALAATLGRPGRTASNSEPLFPLHAIWFPAAPPPNLPDAPLDIRFRGPAELAIFRGAWDNPRALFVGFKAGRARVNHSHLDLGSFVLDADGVRWAADLGSDSYALPEFFGAKRWSYFRINNRSHNTLTPGDALQDRSAVAPIVAYGSTPARAFAVADLTSAYPGAAHRILRGIALLDRSRVLVQDDVTGLRRDETLVWRLLTAADVVIDDARHATLTRAGRRLRAEILTPADASFSTRAATPPTAAENQNQGITVLVATLAPQAADTRLAVLLTPLGDGWPASPPPPEIVALDHWQ